MTKEEMRSLKIDDIVRFNRVNEQCAVEDVNDEYAIVDWNGISVFIEERNLDQFDIIPKKQFVISSKAVYLYETVVEATNEEEAKRIFEANAQDGYWDGEEMLSYELDVLNVRKIGE